VDACLLVLKTLGLEVWVLFWHALCVGDDDDDDVDDDEDNTIDGDDDDGGYDVACANRV